MALEDVAHLGELGEDEAFFRRIPRLLRASRASRCELSGAAGGGRIVSKELGGVVADLFELRKRRQDDPLALDALGGVDLFGGVFDHGLVERRLFLGQSAEHLHLQLVGQIGDDRFVGLEAAEDERAGELLEPSGGVGVAVGLDGDLERASEFGLGAEQAGVEEFDDRPKVADVVLDGRAGQGDPGIGRAGAQADLACLVCGFLMFWASSRTSAVQAGCLRTSKSRCSSA